MYMRRLTAFQFTSVDSPEAATLTSLVNGCRRFVYNKALPIQNEMYELSGHIHHYAQLCKLLTVWRAEEETKSPADSPSHTQ